MPPLLFFHFLVNFLAKRIANATTKIAKRALIAMNQKIVDRGIPENFKKRDYKHRVDFNRIKIDTNQVGSNEEPSLSIESELLAAPINW